MQGSAWLVKDRQYKTGQDRIVLGRNQGWAVQVRTGQDSTGPVKGGQYRSGQGRVVLGQSRVVSTSQDRAG